MRASISSLALTSLLLNMERSSRARMTWCAATATYRTVLSRATTKTGMPPAGKLIKITLHPVWVEASSLTACPFLCTGCVSTKAVTGAKGKNTAWPAAASHSITTPCSQMSEATRRQRGGLGVGMRARSSLQQVRVGPSRFSLGLTTWRITPSSSCTMSEDRCCSASSSATAMQCSTVIYTDQASCLCSCWPHACCSCWPHGCCSCCCGGHGCITVHTWGQCCLHLSRMQVDLNQW